MKLNIFSFIGWLIGTAGSVFSFLFQGVMAVLSTLSSLFLAPFRWGMDALHHTFNIPFQWTPLFLLGGAVLILLLLILSGLALSAKRNRK